jgi:hypothetical protein
MDTMRATWQSRLRKAAEQNLRPQKEKALMKRQQVLAVVLFSAVSCTAQTTAASSPSSTPASQSDNTAEISARPVMIVGEFSTAEKAGWPYDTKQLQYQTVAELKAKAGDHIDVMSGPPATPRNHTYTLAGEIVSWRPGNRAKRMLVGMGSGRESAEIHYWLTDEQGKRIFDHKDTIRAEFWGNAYQSSVGELAHPFASKIADRLTETKLF